MIKAIEDKINELRFLTRDNLKSIELAHIPYAYYLNYKNVTKFDFDGKIYDYTEELKDTNNSKHIILVHNLPFSFNSRNNITYIDKAYNLIEIGEMIPFLLFVNGKLIKLSDITVIRNYRYSYLEINNIEYNMEEDQIICLLAPFNIRYNEGLSISEEDFDKSMLYFDIDGKLTTDINKIYTCIEILDNNTSCQRITGENRTGFRFKFIYEGTDEPVDLDELSYILDNEYSTSNLKDVVSYVKVYNDDDESVEKVDIIEIQVAKDFQIHTRDYGQVGFIENCLIFENGILKLELRDLLYENGLNYIGSENTDLEIRVFKYNNSPTSKDLIYKIPNSKLVKTIIDNDNNSILNDLKNNNFNFSFNKKKSYKYNLNKAFEYISAYDFDLFNDIIKSQSKISSIRYTGKQLKSLMKEDNYFSILRRKDEFNRFSYCIIFLNNKLYKYHHMCEYLPLYFKMYIPTGYIQDTDIIEILYFKNVDNSEIPVEISDSKELYLSNDINLSNLDMYHKGIPNQLYEIDNEYTLEKVDFSFDKVDNKYIINMEDRFYNEQLFLLYRNRFAYHYSYILEDCLDVELESKFLYCRNKSQYMIFINGKFINIDKFELKYPEKDQPINNMAIYFYIPLYKGTTVNIFYIPREISYITEDNINENGYISVDINKIQYPLDKECYLYFVNGEKVNPDNITNINKNTIKLDIDMKSINNLTILRHIKEVEDLTTVFLNKSSWDLFLDGLTDEDRDKLFNLTTVLQSNESSNIYEDIISKEELVYELVAQYYLRNGLTDGNEFIYTLDDCIIDDNDIDGEGTNIIRLMDTNKEDKANIYGVKE